MTDITSEQCCQLIQTYEPVEENRRGGILGIDGNKKMSHADGDRFFVLKINTSIHHCNQLSSSYKVAMICLFKLFRAEYYNILD